MKTIWFACTLALIGVTAPAANAGAAAPVPAWRAPAPADVVAPGVRTDRVSVRLTRAAARFALRQAGTAPARALGLPGLDRALAALDARIEPEFRGEVPSPEGSGQPDFTEFYLMDLPSGRGVAAALQRLRGVPEVASAAEIPLASVTAVPNDSLWSGAYYFYQPSRKDIHALEGWDICRGDTSIVVALIDTGLLPYHPDIGGLGPRPGERIWTNWVEAGGLPGVDDDGNGFVDDVRGWDFVNLPSGVPITAGEDWRDEDGDPNDFVGHGTSVAGVLGALNDNGIGVNGTAWAVGIMPLRVGWSETERQTGVVDMSYLAQAVRYATRMGAAVINISLSTSSLIELDQAIDAATQAGVVVVVAAGNNGSPNALTGHTDVTFVTATDRNDVVPIWANRGNYVDLAAPGAELETTTLARPGTDSIGVRQPNYNTSVNGTSFATPLVSGAAALVQARRKSLGLFPLESNTMRELLAGSSDDISAENPGAVGIGQGRLNLERALTSASLFRARRTDVLFSGPGVGALSSTGTGRLAFVTGSDFLLLDPESLALVLTAPSSLGITRGLAAAELGGQRGTGFFAAAGLRIGGFGGGGARLPGWPVIASFGSALSAMPALADLDGDGTLDVVGVIPEGWVFAWNSLGEPRAGFPAPLTLGATGVTAPALADLDGQPGAEIVVAHREGIVHALRGDGSKLPGWPITLPSPRPAAPLVGRWGGETRVILVGDRGLYALRADGTLAASVEPAGKSVEPPLDPALADVDGDGVDDVVVAGPTTLTLYRGGAGFAPTTLATGRAFHGTLLVGSLVAGGPAEILVPDGGSLLTIDATGAVAEGVPALAVTGSFPMLLPPPATGPARLLVPSDVDRALYLFDTGMGPAPAEPAAWPSARGNAARTGSHLDPPPIGIADDQPPLPVADLRGVAQSAHQAGLGWTAPLDDRGRVAEYDLRLSYVPINDENFANAIRMVLPLPAEPGAPEAVSVTTTFGVLFVAIRSRDSSGNWSNLSTTEILMPHAEPDPVHDLAVTSVGDVSVDLGWTATGDDGWVGTPDHYLLAIVRRPWSGGPFPADAQVRQLAASVAGGGHESVRVEGLDRHASYWFGLQAVDATYHVSTTSNVVGARTGTPGSGGADLGLAVASNPSRLPVAFYWSTAQGTPGARWIRIYDVKGRLRTRLALGPEDAGIAHWSGDALGGRAEAGVYFAVFSVGATTAVTRFVLLP